MVYLNKTPETQNTLPLFSKKTSNQKTIKKRLSKTTIYNSLIAQTSEK